jgi:hypothetical protein
MVYKPNVSLSKLSFTFLFILTEVDKLKIYSPESTFFFLSLPIVSTSKFCFEFLYMGL